MNLSSASIFDFVLAATSYFKSHLWCKPQMYLFNSYCGYEGRNTSRRIGTSTVPYQALPGSRKIINVLVMSPEVGPVCPCPLCDIFLTRCDIKWRLSTASKHPLQLYAIHLFGSLYKPIRSTFHAADFGQKMQGIRSGFCFDAPIDTQICNLWRNIFPIFLPFWTK